MVMNTEKTETDLISEIHDFVKAGFSPHFDRLKETFKTNGLWQRLCRLGSELWLDTGSMADAKQFWTQQFSALTTNNTLLNKEVQTGRYDSLIAEAARILSAYPQLSQHQRLLEIAFILNAFHALRLVEKFDAYVSVEEHTALAHNVDQAVNYAKRFYAICPQRFIIKIPFTPAGLLVTRRLSAEGIPVNHTLGFSARQNYLIARIARPAYVNVFLGRLNSFIPNNNLGQGSYIGEKATLASQAAIKKLRQAHQTPTRQIGASFRAAKQVQDLAGIDVMTIPPKVAGKFLSLGLTADQITDRTDMNYKPALNEDVDPDAIRLDTLWDIGDELIACVDALEKENLDSFTSADLISFFKGHHCSDILVPWSDSQIHPQLKNWQDQLADKSIGLDSLMNLAGLNSFATDQKAMDDRVSQVLPKSDKITTG